MVLAFSGKIGSGKSSLAKKVAKELDWKLVSFGDFVRKEATNRGIEHQREYLQDLGEELLQVNSYIFCKSVLDQIEWQNKSFIIDGIRHWAVYKILQELVSPMPICLIYLAIDESERLNRLGKRDDVSSLSKMHNIDNHPTEVDVQLKLPSEATLVLNSELPVGVLVKSITSWVFNKKNL
ncbi:ATP-binding protein [Pontibacter sp. MBLB2868]|uniref:ATP-binding protein n=1 Tax=Pontibacter sp. MBLB2868 TaxID=3451555 RepID=UPI003F74E2A2